MWDDEQWEPDNRTAPHCKGFLLPLNFVLPVVPRFAPSLSHVALQEKARFRAQTRKCEVGYI